LILAMPAGIVDERSVAGATSLSRIADLSDIDRDALRSLSTAVYPPRAAVVIGSSRGIA
jgi:hypothetical protein